MNNAGRQVRNRWAVAGLIVVTLGAYGFYWWYKVNAEINDEVERLGLEVETTEPRRALAAITIGLPLVVPPVYSLLKTTRAIESLEVMSCVKPSGFWDGTINRRDAVLLMIGFPPVGAAYVQGVLNRIWLAHSLDYDRDSVSQLS